MANARTGELALEFNWGRPQRFRRHEVCSPPKDDDTPPGVPKWPTQFCPVDGAAMAEDHTHEKFKCVSCQTVTTFSELRKHGRFTAHE